MVVLGLGVLQLVAGIVIGRCWPAPNGNRRATLDANRLDALADEMFGVVDHVAAGVDEHQAQIDAVNQKLAAAGSGAAAHAAATQSIVQILRVNEQLQQRLHDAETKLSKQTEELQAHIAAALTDSLTGLPNRRAFDQELRRQLVQWPRRKTPTYLVIVDADNFKRLNDQFGHLIGDQALKAMAEAMHETMKGKGLAARIGGEEFGVLLSGLDTEQLAAIAERLRLAVAAQRICSEISDLRVTISQGISIVQHGDDESRLFKRADDAMYASKRAGRNATHLHDGAGCLRIDQRRDSSQKPRDPAPPVELPQAQSTDLAEMDAMFDDLRNRLAEVTESSAS